MRTLGPSLRGRIPAGLGPRASARSGGGGGATAGFTAEGVGVCYRRPGRNGDSAIVMAATPLVSVFNRVAATRSPRGPAPIDDEVRTGHVLGSITRQEHDGSAIVGATRHPAERHVLGVAAHELLVLAGV